MDNISYNAELFKQAINCVDFTYSEMDRAATISSSIAIPNDYANAEGITNLVQNINGNLKPKMDALKDMFDGLPEVVADLENGEEPLYNDYRINISNIIVNSSCFDAHVGSNGTYYTYNEGLRNSKTIPFLCNIYVPNNEKLNGVTIYFSGLGQTSGSELTKNDAFLREYMLSGEVKLNSVLVLPAEYYDYASSDSYKTINANNSKKIVEGTKNIAKSFGVNSDNLNIYAFSGGGALGTSLIFNNEPGTFKNIVMASNVCEIDTITDPNVRVIELMGIDEIRGNSVNAQNVVPKIKEFEESRLNKVENYILEGTEDVPVVDHGHVSEIAMTKNQINGGTIFDYIYGEEE